MKVGILTVHSQLNYGGVLQAYALQKTIQSLGYDVELINYWCSKNNIALTGGFVGAKGPLIKRLFRLIVNLVRNGLIFSEIQRRRKTQDFIRSFCEVSSLEYRNFESLSSIEKYENVVVGSDQVWNYKWHGCPNPFLLIALKGGCRRVAYAASFGVKSIPGERVAEYANALKCFHAISVRERDGIRIVKELASDLKPETALDPTLLLDRDAWLSVCDHLPEESEKYVMCYWLGDFKRLYRVLNQYVMKKGLFVHLFGNVEILHASYGSFLSVIVRVLLLMNPRIKCCFNAGPCEFIRGVADSDAVVSDSFHAMTLACIFNKPARIFIDSAEDRKEMSSRMTDLANQLSASELISKSIPKSGNDLSFSALDVDEFNSKLQKRKRDSLMFLQDALA